MAFDERRPVNKIVGRIHKEGMQKKGLREGKRIKAAKTFL